MRIDYTIQIWREGSHYVAQALPLDVASAGPTPEQARAALDEAVHLFLDTARSMGTLGDILRECGYEFRDGVWHAPEWVAVEQRFAIVA